MTLECFQAFDFRIRAFVLRCDLGDIAINELMKGGAFRLGPRDKDAPVDFAFDHAYPGLGIGFGFEGFALGRIAITANLRSPLPLAKDMAAIPDHCHFDHPRHA
ncbi:hypothetical protein [Pseudomonas amygdali]|uniref:hypothetical protein n=1 Tax=Pseudomonas amygdali TaxID=47877 RepID=UPI000B21A27C|nr:hypothetical protein [Pseudomonas amygdali]